MRAIFQAYRWFQVVLPPVWVLCLATLCYGFTVGLQQFVLKYDAAHEAMHFGQMRHVVVIALAVLYGCYRGTTFHPAFQEDYLAWLSRTPWRFPKPLPLGPVLVVSQDWIVLLLLEVMLLDAPLEMRIVVIGSFFFALCSCWAIWIWLTDSRSAAYEMGFALGAVVLAYSFSPLVAAALMIAVHILSLMRWKQSFAAFPWLGYTMWKQIQPWQISRPRSTPHRSGLADLRGWPYDMLSPQPLPQLPRQERLMIAGLVSWWMFVLLSLISRLAPRELVVMNAQMILALAAIHCLFSVLQYVGSHWPPISFLARITTGKWIIPSYDAALLPLVYYFGAVAVAYFAASPAILGLSSRYGAPMTLMTYLSLVAIATPDLNKWRLTCKMRMGQATYINNKQFEQL
ncbi:MAG: hypothetical protein ACO1RA_11560 [Planctomycetaceae bacterium]